MAYFELKQQVFDIRFGEGIVNSIHPSDTFSVEVLFKAGLAYYTSDGRFQENEYPSLFQKNPIVTPNKPLNNFKKGELVWCKHEPKAMWTAQFYSREEKGIHYVFSGMNKKGIDHAVGLVLKYDEHPMLKE